MRTHVLTLVIMLLVLPAAGCSGGDGSTGDAGPDVTDTAGPDGWDAADPGEDSHPDPPVDTAADPDASTDTVEDDADTDTAEDPDADTAGCLPLEADMTSVESWVLCWMGTGTNVAFTIRYVNPSSSCDITSVAVTAGTLRLSSDGTTLMTFGPTPPRTSFSGTVAAGASVSVDYHAGDTTLDTQAHDGATVHVTADVSSSAGTLSLTSADTAHTCVY